MYIGDSKHAKETTPKSAKGCSRSRRFLKEQAEDWTTTKSAKGISRQRKYSEEEGDDINFTRQKEAFTSRLVIPEDDYFTPRRSLQKKPVSY